MKHVWNWGIFFEEIPGGGEQYWSCCSSGVGWTLAVSACAWVIALALGSVIGTIRTTDKPWLVRLGNAWVELFRNIPLLVQMFLWYFVIPEFIPPLKAWMVKAEPAHAQFMAAVLCLGLFTSARVAEQVRAGIQSLPRGQRYAGMAVGLTVTQVYRYVLLPMALPDRHPAADQRDDEPDQELVDRADHRPRRAHVPRPARWASTRSTSSRRSPRRRSSTSSSR